MQQNQCKATSSRSANSDEQIKGWILLLLHHEPQDKIKSFTDTRERISGRGTKLFDIRKVFPTRWDRLSRQPGKMSRTGKKNFSRPEKFFSTRWDCQFGSLPVFFAGPCWGSVPWIPSRGCGVLVAPFDPLRVCGVLVAPWIPSRGCGVTRNMAP